MFYKVQKQMCTYLLTQYWLYRNHISEYFDRVDEGVRRKSGLSEGDHAPSGSQTTSLKGAPRGRRSSLAFFLS